MVSRLQTRSYSDGPLYPPGPSRPLALEFDVKTLRASATAWILVATLAACAAEESVQYSRREAVPLAAWTVTLRSTEKLTGQVIPDVVRAAKPGSIWLAVHVELDYQGPDEAGREQHLRSLLQSIRLRIVDGEDFEPIMAPMTESHLKTLKYGRSATLEDMQAWIATSDWKRIVIVFAPPRDSRGLKLLIDNYDRRDQQPRSVEIDMGR